MAKTNYHYYVLVFTSEGPIYVTSVDYSTKEACWNKDKAPLELSASSADDLVLGLNCNFFNAVLIRSKFEIETQPYRYNDFDINFIKREKKAQ